MEPQVTGILRNVSSSKPVLVEYYRLSIRMRVYYGPPTLGSHVYSTLLLQQVEFGSRV